MIVFCVFFGFGSVFISFVEGECELTASQGPIIPVLDVFKKTVTPGKTPVIDVFENENVYNGCFPGCHGFFENVQNEKSVLVMLFFRAPALWLGPFGNGTFY